MTNSPHKMHNNHPWIEAMRLRTLPVSCAGVIAGTAVAMVLGSFRWLPALLCLIFAILAQVASNFANEYFDYRNGLDQKGRAGFRRGVTEGDISSRAMLNATFGILLAACAVGMTLIHWGGWLMLPIGVLIALFALAYSAGPYPLSHHGLGDIAVVIFFGIVPVCLTAWLQLTEFTTILAALPISIGVGLLAANVLIVNNYRDADDDRSVGKRTTVVIFGRPAMAALYLLNVIMGSGFICVTMASLLDHTPTRVIAMLCAPAAWWGGTIIWQKLRRGKGAQLNPLLKNTAQLLLAVAVAILILAAIG